MEDRRIAYSILYDLDELTLACICSEIVPDKAKYCGNALIIIGCLEGNIEVAEGNKYKLELLREILIKCSLQNEKIKNQYNNQMDILIKECINLLTSFFNLHR